MSKNVGGHRTEHHLRIIMQDGTTSLTFQDGHFYLLDKQDQNIGNGRDLNDMIADYYGRRARALASDPRYSRKARDKIVKLVT